MNRRLSVRAVVVHKGKLLCVRLQPNAARVSQPATYWCLPGGGLESGEDLISALEREMVEETGVRPQVGHLLYIQQFQDDKAEYLDFFFAVTNGADFVDIDLAQTSHGAKEIAEIGFYDPKRIYLLPKFLSQVSLESDIQAGQTRYFNYL